MPAVDDENMRDIADLDEELLDSTSHANNLLTDSSRLLRERKEALITAAVTGQFDVTTASARSVA